MTEEDHVKTIKSKNLPDDPHDDDWMQAIGPDGDVSVEHVHEPFQLDDEPPHTSGWIIWNRKSGYRSVDHDTFDDDYEIKDEARRGANPGSADSFGLD
jgi:hypothetical protein